MSCLAIGSTDNILKVVRDADPEGTRTIGVLTKADLVHDKDVFRTLHELVSGSSLPLGYFVVRNRCTGEDSLSLDQCKNKERQLFQKPEWAAIAALRRTGVDTLRNELRRLVANLDRQELLRQSIKLTGQLEDSRKALEEMGPPRNLPASQREYLTLLACRFEEITRNALQGRYANAVFSQEPGLKLIDQVVTLNHGFSSLMAEKGHTARFQTDLFQVSVSKAVEEYETALANLYNVVSEYPELRGILPTSKLKCAGPSGQSIAEHMTTVYKEKRSPELGTLGENLLGALFREQAKKWGSIVDGHMGAMIVTVHGFVRKLVEVVAGDPRIRKEIWGTILLDKLLEQYRRAIRHADFLIDVELNSLPMAVEPFHETYFGGARAMRLAEGTQDASATADQQVIKPGAVYPVTGKTDAEQVAEDMDDVLRSYYIVSLKRLVDAVCRQAINHFLLRGPESPLQIIRPATIARLSDDQLNQIAGEDNPTKGRREHLKSEIFKFGYAVKELRDWMGEEEV